MNKKKMAKKASKVKPVKQSKHVKKACKAKTKKKVLPKGTNSTGPRKK